MYPTKPKIVEEKVLVKGSRTSKTKTKTETSMERSDITQHVRTLIALPVTETPIISCYQAVTNGRLADRNAFTERVRELRQGLSGSPLREFESALERIDDFVSAQLSPDTRGTAVFSRGGSEPFFLPLQFRVPLPNWIAVDATPNIYHLVELKDKYDRYVVMIVTEESARILQVNLGSVTAQMWQHRPDLRRRVGREWTKMHFQKHLNERNRRFINDAIGMVDSLMSAGKYSHLILAGHASMTSQVQRELPKHLVEKLVNSVSASSTTPLNSVVEATLAAFVEAEQQESLDAVADLLNQLRTGGLAAVGTKSSFQAIHRGQADVLVLAKEYSAEQGWSCHNCDNMDVESRRPDSCPECGGQSLHEFDIREQIIRKAEECDVSIEVVTGSDELIRQGGIGCLLRYRLPEQY